MSARPRTLLIGLALIGAALLVVAGVGWLNRPDTVDGRAPVPTTAVILVPGYGGGAEGLAGLADHLRRSGRAVVIADIGDGHGDLRAYGRQVAQLARTVAADTGAAAGVDLVGYSAGGLIARAAVEADPEAIGRVATIAAPHHGTAVAGLGAMLGNASSCPTACQQMAPDSEFLSSLTAPGDATRWLSAWSPDDDVVRPADSSLLDGASNLEVMTACGTGSLDHGGIVRSPATWSVVTAFLSSGIVPEECD